MQVLGKSVSTAGIKGFRDGAYLLLTLTLQHSLPPLTEYFRGARSS